MEILLPLLRIGASVLLVLFLFTMFWLLWRDFLVVSKEVEARTLKRGRLVVMRGNVDGLTPGTVFPLLPLTSLGRAPNNTVPCEDAFISNVHALITLRGGQWWLEDQGSSNGTQLNGQSIDQPVVVTTGDTIGIGKIELRLELE